MNTTNVYEHTTDRATYYLNRKMVSSGGGKATPFFYFTRTLKPDTGCDLPEGYVVVVSNNMPVLRKAKASTST